MQITRWYGRILKIEKNDEVLSSKCRGFLAFLGLVRNLNSARVGMYIHPLTISTCLSPDRITYPVIHFLHQWHDVRKRIVLQGSDYLGLEKFFANAVGCRGFHAQ